MSTGVPIRGCASLQLHRCRGTPANLLRRFAVPQIQSVTSPGETPRATVAAEKPCYQYCAIDPAARSIGPGPVCGFGHVDAVLMGIVAACDLLVEESFLGVAADSLQPGDAVHDIHGEAEAVDIVVDRQFQRRVDASFLLVSTHVDVGMIGAPISQAVNQLRVAMEVEHDRFIHREERIEFTIQQSVWMLAGWLELEQIDHIDEANLEVREFLT